jgi:hypothetical protein
LARASAALRDEEDSSTTVKPVLPAGQSPTSGAPAVPPLAGGIGLGSVVVVGAGVTLGCAEAVGTAVVAAGCG